MVKLYRLISPFEGFKWSFLNGVNVFENAVWLSDLNDLKKYKLIDKDGKEADYNLDDCLEEVFF